MLPDFAQRLITNTGFSGIRFGITVAIALFLVPYMLWRLGTEKYGLWVIIQIFSAGGILSFAELGFMGALVRFLSRHKTDGDREAFLRLYHSGLGLFLAIGTICGVGVFLFAQFLSAKLFRLPELYRDEVVLALSIYGGVVASQFFTMAVRAYYAGVQDFLRLEIWEVLPHVCFASIIIILLSFTDDLVLLVVSEISVIVFLGALFFLLPFRYHRSDYRLDFRYFSFSSLREIGGFAKSLFSYRSLGLIYLHLPRLLTALLLTPAHVAFFNIVERIPLVIRQLYSLANAAALPVAASLDDGVGKDDLRDLLLRGTRYSLFIFLPLILTVSANTEGILLLWVGSEFVHLADLFRLYLGWVAVFLLVSLGAAMYTEAEQYRRVVPFNFLAIVALLAGALSFVDDYGMESILIAFLLSAAIPVGAHLYVQFTSYNLNRAQYFRKIILAPILYSGSATGLILISIERLVDLNIPATLVLQLLVVYFAHVVMGVLFYADTIERNILRAQLPWIARFLWKKSIF